MWTAQATRSGDPERAADMRDATNCSGEGKAEREAERAEGVSERMFARVWRAFLCAEGGKGLWGERTRDNRGQNDGIEVRTSAEPEGPAAAFPNRKKASVEEDGSEARKMSALSVVESEKKERQSVGGIERKMERREEAADSGEIDFDDREERIVDTEEEEGGGGDCGVEKEEERTARRLF